MVSRSSTLDRCAMYTSCVSVLCGVSVYVGSRWCWGVGERRELLRELGMRVLM